MTQYLLSVPASVDAPEPPMEELQQMFDAVGRFNDTVMAAGAWVFAGGLQPIHSATTVDGRGEQPVITDGPFAESKEYLGGFWVIEAADLDVALDWAAKGSKACGKEVEVRPFQDDSA